MKINIRANNSVEIEGYVNAVERNSRPISDRFGNFLERVMAGAFRKSLHRGRDIKLLLDHKWNRQLGSIGEGNLELEEDNIGLHARATITDPEVVEAARRGDLVGWSFGYKDLDVERGMEEGKPLRKIRDLDLYEVSIIDRMMIPSYPGTSLATRAEDGKEEIYFRAEPFEDEVETVVEKPVENSENDEKPENAENVEKVEKRAENVEKTAENTGKTDENGGTTTTEGGSQEPKDGVVEKPVEKNDKTLYNKAINIIKKMKEN